MSTHFGEHITIDGYGGDPEYLDSQEIVSAALTELCTTLGMRPLADPFVISAPENHSKDPGGWSGFLVIAESHISIHTFPRRRFLSADVYTCRNGIDHTAVVSFFREKFRLEDVETHFLKRGLKYPEHNLL